MIGESHRDEGHEREMAERDAEVREAPGAGGDHDVVAVEGERLARACEGDAASLAASLEGVPPAIRSAALRAAQQLYGNQFVNGVVREAPAPADGAPPRTAVPRTSPSKKGKDPKYKTTAWASARLFEQLDGDQRTLLDDYAVANPKPIAVPRRPDEPGPDDEVAPLPPTADHALASEAAVEPETSADAETETAIVPDVSPGALLWGDLDLNRRAGFLNLTAAMRGNGFSLSCLGLLHDGIQQDRLLFTPASGSSIKSTLDDAIRNRKSLGDRGFKKDVPQEGMHPGMAEWGGRQCVTRCSMQVGGGSGGVFVDIDKFNPKQNVVGLFGHMFEVLDNKLGDHKTDPFDIARALDERGDDP